MSFLTIAFFSSVFLSGLVRSVPISQFLQQPNFSTNINRVFQQPMLQPAHQQLMMQQQHPTMTNNVFFQQMRQQQQQPFINQFRPQNPQFINQQQPLGIQPTFITQQQPTFLQQQPQQYSQQQPQVSIPMVQQIEAPNGYQQPSVQTVGVKAEPVLEVREPEIEVQRQPAVVEVSQPVTNVEVKNVAAPNTVVERTPTEIHNLINEQNEDLETLNQLVRHHIDQNRIIMEELRTFVRQSHHSEQNENGQPKVTSNENVFEPIIPVMDTYMEPMRSSVIEEQQRPVVAPIQSSIVIEQQRPVVENKVNFVPAINTQNLQRFPVQQQQNVVVEQNVPMQSSIVVEQQRPVISNKVNFVPTINTQNLQRVPFQQQQNVVVEQNVPLQTQLNNVPNRQSLGKTPQIVSDNTQQIIDDQNAPVQSQKTNMDQGGFTFPRLEPFVQQQQQQQKLQNNRF